MTRGVGQHHGDLRRALLDAALALVAEGDIHALTLREVARRAGVSPAAPYHHFPDKGALLAEVAREGFAALGVAQARALAPHPPAPAPRTAAPLSPGERLAAMAAEYVRFARAHATHYAVMFALPPHAVTGAGADTLRATARGTFDTLVAAIQAANPELGAEEAGRRALLAWAQAHGAVAVSAWSAGLESDMAAEDLALGVGQAVRALAEAPVQLAAR